MNVLRYNKFNFIEENKVIDKLNENNDGDQGFGQSPLGPGYGFAQDPSLSIYSDGSTPYTDGYARMSNIVKDLNKILKDLYSQGATSISNHKFDYFMEDVEEFKDLKILRVFVNNKLNLDVYISFDFMDEEFFGVFRDFNGEIKTQLKTDLFTDERFNYIDREYKLKLSNYFYKIIFNWFIPDSGKYVILSDELIVRDYLGSLVKLNKGKELTVKGYNNDTDNKPFLMVKVDTDIYKITNNDFFYFKYRVKMI